MSPKKAIGQHHNSSQKWLAMLGMCLGTLMFVLDTSAVNIAVPTLIKAFNTSFAIAQLVVVSYLLAITSLLLGAARLGDIWGRKQLYLVGLAIFTIGSLLCGLAPSIYFLIGFRVLQGLGAVFISALGPAMVTEIFPSSERGKALGIFSTVVSVGIASGPTIGGFLIDISSWRAIFFVNVPVGLLAGYVVTRFVAKSATTNKGQKSFDVAGAVIFMLTLVAFTVGMNQGQDRGWDSQIVFICGAIAVLGAIGFIVIESRIAQPIFDLGLLRNSQLALGLSTKLLVFIVLSGAVFVLPFFIEKAMGYSIQKTGLLMAASPLLGAVFSPISGILADRFGSRIISLCGLCLIAIGCYCLSTFDAQLTDWGYIARVAPFGIGIGLFQSPNNSTILGEAPQDKIGVVSGLLALSRTVGQTIGVPIMASLLVAFTAGIASGQATAIMSASKLALIGGIKATFLVATVIMSLGVVLAVVELQQYSFKKK
ncbi:MFS transporter [Pleurocapsa sp. FMAR1]|uniref:MFS transporter n=1 Tax=Pleurocapsa sp. FMAR1 TaxID=3040204 RepID=UPI0029C7064A|nr:MFS transporter [Pleurocapsa sp. FMAR1]